MTRHFEIDYHQRKLVSKDKEAIVTIKDEFKEKGTIKDRDFEKNITQLFSKDYSELNLFKKEPPYSGVEFKELPNITILPNLKTKEGFIVMGSTMGHYQEAMDGSKLPILEIYEYFGFGAMLIDNKDDPFMELHYLKPGDKVFTMNRCNMTLYNLDMHPLITNDFANPKIHQGDKTLQKEIGPSLIIRQDGVRMDFKLNERYINREDGLGVKLEDFEDKDLLVQVHAAPGKEIYDKLGTEKVRKEFEKIGIRLVPGEQSPFMFGQDLEGNLFDIVTKDNVLQNYFRMQQDK